MHDIVSAITPVLRSPTSKRSLTFFRDVLELEVLGSREIRDDYFGQIVGLPGSAVKAALIRLPGGHHHRALRIFGAARGRA